MCIIIATGFEKRGFVILNMKMKTWDKRITNRIDTGKINIISHIIIQPRTVDQELSFAECENDKQDFSLLYKSDDLEANNQFSINTEEKVLDANEQVINYVIGVYDYNMCRELKFKDYDSLNKKQWLTDVIIDLCIFNLIKAYNLNSSYKFLTVNQSYGALYLCSDLTRDGIGTLNKAKNESEIKFNGQHLIKKLLFATTITRVNLKFLNSGIGRLNKAKNESEIKFNGQHLIKKLLFATTITRVNLKFLNSGIGRLNKAKNESENQFNGQHLIKSYCLPPP
ncbi:hypothetical protein FQR65_LT12895 [Abscondita terminalis]|nr:hypothetical protein FQR65_LT12895 [Abscondita terminalis]